MKVSEFKFKTLLVNLIGLKIHEKTTIITHYMGNQLFYGHILSVVKYFVDLLLLENNPFLRVKKIHGDLFFAAHNFSVKGLVNLADAILRFNYFLLLLLVLKDFQKRIIRFFLFLSRILFFGLISGLFQRLCKAVLLWILLLLPG